MDFFIRRFIKTHLVSMLSVFYFISFPVFSASTFPLFTAINLAFIAGLSLPIIVVSLLYKSKVILKLRAFLLLTVSLMGVVCFSIFSKKGDVTPEVLFFAILYLTSLYFSFSSKEALFKCDLLMIPNIVVVMLTAAYSLLLWFYFDHSHYIIWAAVSFIILMLITLRIKHTAKELTPSLFKMMAQWLPAVYFSVMVFLWIEADISHQWFLIHCVVSYIAFGVARFWSVAENTYVEDTEPTQPLNSSTFNTIESEDDEATNLPSQQQALNSINKLIKLHPNDDFSIIVFKPVNFQQVNKVLGHHNSDILLLQLAYCLQKGVETNNHLVNFNKNGAPVRIARLQGLQFLVALQLKNEEVNARELIEELCQSLRLSVPNAMSFKSFSLNFELTFGVSFLADYKNSLSQVIAYAEDALLAAENNQLPLQYFNQDEVIYTELNLLQMERLKEDITDENLYWYVQPQSRLKDRKLVGFELLVQWRNTENVPVEFQGFIDTAEHSGEIYLLTKQMITHAFKLILKLQRMSNYETVSIKLLSQHILEPDLVSFIEKHIALYNVPAKYLMIELPEKVVLSACEKAKIIIDELKSLDVNIGISDFSGSYESLRYIRKLAVQQIKIDCEHLGETADDSEKAIIAALVELTQKMKLPLIGTSINDRLTETAFSSMGGEFIQGYVVDKGVEIDKIDNWVKRWNSLYNPV